VSVAEILLVEEESRLSRTLSLTLRRRGHLVRSAATPVGALAALGRRPADAVLLDLGLAPPPTSIAELHARAPKVPIVVLSARDDTADKVAALEQGALDYLTKPFEMTELLARLGAALRHLPDARPTSVLLGAVLIDLDARQVQAETGHRIHLTPTEWRILDVLLRRPSRLVTGRELLSLVRPDPARAESSYLRGYLAALRHKLEADPTRPRYLITEPGLGYRYQP
jgi:two-component system KDP operon response regulator KdpE